MTNYKANSNITASSSNRTAVNSNKKPLVIQQNYCNSIFANTDASLAKFGKNVMGLVESKALLLTAISPSLYITDL